MSFVLVGDNRETKPRTLADEKRPILQRGTVDGFVMSTSGCLGKLSHLRLVKVIHFIQKS